jgi:stage II sporulation protein D
MRIILKKWTMLVTATALLTAIVLTNPVYASADNGVMQDINKAFVADVTDTGNGMDLQLIVNGKLMPFHTNNKSFIPHEGEFISLKAKDDRIVKIQGDVPVASTQEKIMTKNTNAKTLDLELTGTVQLADGYTVYQTINGQTVQKSLSDVYVGASNVTVYFDESGKVNLILIEGQTPVNNMRVGIMNAGYASLDHSQLDFQSADGLKVVDKKAGQSFDIAPNTVVTFLSTTASTQVTVSGSVLYTSPNRLYVEPATNSSEIQIMTFKRAYGYPSYRGSFEITPAATAGKLHLINEVQLEDYLKQVVPSEMPASFGIEALKAQSVAARTYALGDFSSSRYATLGFEVDDSTLSQVYNNSAENSLTNEAVTDTSGQIMQDNGQLVDARYYSTSGGFGAGRDEVWADATGQFPGTPVPYLHAQSYTYDPTNLNQMYSLNTQDESALNAFYKNLSLTGYDSDSYYFRWKVNFSRTELENTINNNLAARFAADPAFILTQDASGTFVSKPIPSGGIGTLQNLYVTKRGTGGNMMELVIQGSTGTYKIVKEYNIRFTIRPSKTFTGSSSDVLLLRAKGGSTDYDTGYTLKNYTILPSAFASFDINKANDASIASITFYGGGNGHGVGMSQYGASSLGAKGWTYDQILNRYYAGMQLVNVYQTSN